MTINFVLVACRWSLQQITWTFLIFFYCASWLEDPWRNCLIFTDVKYLYFLAPLLYSFLCSIAQFCALSVISYLLRIYDSEFSALCCRVDDATRARSRYEISRRRVVIFISSCLDCCTWTFQKLYQALSLNISENIWQGLTLEINQSATSLASKPRDVLAWKMNRTAL
jgi:hypothetical protein